MEKPKYTTVKTYLKEVQFESPNTPAFFLGEILHGEAVNQIPIDVQTKANIDLSLYIVELHASIIPQLVTDGKDIMGLNVTYCSIIQITDSDIEADALRRLLTVDIPQDLYGPLRALVFAISSASGFPGIMIGDFDFSERYSEPSTEGSSLCS